ncbi:MAG: hypothetical protein QOG58_1995, partial [Caballeronia sp.]|nr:hypothetical protein [Caballeronia sp.]
MSQDLVDTVELLALYKQRFRKPQTTDFNFCAC